MLLIKVGPTPLLPATVTAKTQDCELLLLSVAVYVIRVVPIGKSYGDAILLGDLTTVGAAFGSCN